MIMIMTYVFHGYAYRPLDWRANGRRRLAGKAGVGLSSSVFAASMILMIIIIIMIIFFSVHIPA